MTITAFADLVERHYVLTDLARTYADCIRSHAVELNPLLPDPAAFNGRLHNLIPDRHLGLRRHQVRRDGPPVAPPAGGVCRVEFRDSVGILGIGPLFSAPADALPHLRAAASLLRGADGLILDLRGCFGGDTDTAALLHGWLMGERIRLGRFEHRGRPSTEYWSDPAISPGYTGPVRILTSERTFSGGEDLAYVEQALGRARVVGEATGGGAHPVEHFDLPNGLQCQIPVARSVIDATGSNWEGTGVRPDVACSAEEAESFAVNELRALPSPGDAS